MSKILVIDDDSENRFLLRARLEQAGHEVTEAKDGRAGLDAIAQALPDLVLLDVMMPHTDGWQVCRTLRAHPRTRLLPVVMLTALTQEIEELRGYESGANDYLTKPWDAAQLLEIVSRLTTPTPAVPTAVEQGGLL